MCARHLMVWMIIFVLCLLMLFQDRGPLAHKVTLVARIYGALVHRTFVIAQAPLHRGLVVALIAGKGDETVLGHLVDLGLLGWVA